MASERRNPLRRYPALGFLAVATALALTLPSKLSAPRSEPASLAEFAPVPGGAGAGGDLQLGYAGSRAEERSTGSERAARAQDAAAGPASAPGPRPAALKRCVGSPPRQTEDPLSPPCVAFFEGDNGGATARGVSGEEIVVVALNSAVLAGCQRQEGSWVDYSEPPAPTDTDCENLMKVYSRYFNERYQTYERRVRILGLYGTGGGTPDTTDKRRAEARATRDRNPFAAVTLTFHTIVPYLEGVTADGVLGVSIDAFARGRYAKTAPLLWGVFPDLEDEAELTAGYVCGKLAGAPAKHSGNVTDRSRERVFGIVSTRSESEPEFAILADLIASELAACGVHVRTRVAASGEIAEAQSEAATGVAALRNAEVTTVILVAKSQTVLAFANAAGATAWSPEWFVPGRRTFSGVDQPGNARALPQEQWRHAFGFSFSPRWGDPGQTHWVRAYQEACPGCALRGPYYFGSYMYDALSLLYHGIQAAGPRLTPQSFDRGMHAIPERPSADPYTPAAYFPRGNYTFVKDAMEIWWDPSGQAPGAEGAPGCYRIPNGGRRSRAHEWRPGDTTAFVDGAPCNGDAPVA